MKRRFSLILAAGLLGMMPLAAVQAADLDKGARGHGGHHRGHVNRCEARFDRCNRWFKSSGDYCSNRMARCEDRMARKYERHQRFMAWKDGLFMSKRHHGHTAMKEGHMSRRSHRSADAVVTK